VTFAGILRSVSMTSSPDMHVVGCPTQERRREEAAEEAKWVQRALSGDHGAFRQIVQRHSGSLYRLAYRLYGDAHEAQDAVQETFARAYQKLEYFDHRYRLSTWLHRITLNICRDHLKSPRRSEHSYADPTESGHLVTGDSPTETSLVCRRQAHRLREAINALRPSYREIIVMKDLREMSFREISNITGTPVTALKIRAVRARARLRKKLKVGPND
jgi:RNA polymerase sigma-70 factor (ECF subfamily)